MHSKRKVRANPVLQGLVAALCACLLLLAPAAVAAPSSPFVVAGGGVWSGSGAVVIPEVLQSDSVGPVVFETGAVGTAYGRFRSAFGSNGEAFAVAGGIDREVAGGSAWSDGFVLTGGSGVLALSAHITGSVAGHAEMDYALFVSTQPFELRALIDTIDTSGGLWSVQLPNAQRVLSTGVANRCGMTGATGGCGHVPYTNFQGAFDQVLSASVPFSDGQTVYVISVLGGGVGVFGGQQDFFHSASFGISVPAGITMSPLSGQAYATAVPEPSVWLLLGIGIAGIAVRGRR